MFHSMLGRAAASRSTLLMAIAAVVTINGNASVWAQSNFAPQADRTASTNRRAAATFDVPAIVIAEPVNPAVVPQPTMGGELMRLRIPLSVMVSPGFSGTVDEYVVDIRNASQAMRVIDFWPKNELYSTIEGNIAVESSSQSDSDFAFNVSGAYEPFGRGNAAGNFHRTAASQERYSRKPPMQTLTASGSLHRGYGAFFKFRPGPVPDLEGSRDVAILCEVPIGWRGDMLQVTMRAVGRTSATGSSGKEVGSSQHWLATHREGDASAAAQAQQYVHQERELRHLATKMQAQVDHRANPNVWRKLGAALDVVPPRIPDNYLASIVFGPASHHFSGGTEHLPVDLRVAALDYWDQRERLISLASAATSAQPQSSRIQTTQPRAMGKVTID